MAPLCPFAEKSPLASTTLMVNTTQFVFNESAINTSSSFSTSANESCDVSYFCIALIASSSVNVSSSQALKNITLIRTKIKTVIKFFIIFDFIVL